MSIASKKRLYVVEYKEVIAIFIFFVLVLFLLNPKDMLKDQILNEKSNYDLSAVYLESMLRLEPENEKLMLAMAQASLKSNRVDWAEKLLKLLRHSTNLALHKESFLLRYHLMRDKLARYQDGNEYENYLRKCRKLMHDIVTNSYYSMDTLEQWYHEALSIGADANALTLLKQMIVREQATVKEYESCLYLSQKVGDSLQEISCLESLLTYDTKRNKKWKEASYSIYTRHEMYDKAEKVLSQMAESSLFWKERLAQHHLQLGHYKSASDIYVLLLQHSDDYEEKKRYFLAAVETLQAGGHLNTMALSAKQYEQLFIHDIGIQKRLIQFYLAADRLDLAENVAKELLSERQ